MGNFPLNSEPPSAVEPRASERSRICIVTGELAGPDFNGGIGTTNRALALFLTSQGHRVDILYTRVSNGAPFSARGTFAEHVIAFAELGIRLFVIENSGEWNDWQAKSYEAMDHLLSRDYDLALFDDTHGAAYYPLLARRTGNKNLLRTVMAVTTHSATQWISDINETLVTTIEELRLMEMERRSIELADAVKAPSAYLLKKYIGYGWELPQDHIVLPNLVAVKGTQAKTQRRVPVREIVFVGRLETRKGIWMFCRTLDRLKYKLIGKTVTFLGKGTLEAGTYTTEQVLRRSAGWPFPIRIITDFNREQAIAYLKGDGRIAVAASPEDNSPSTILECLDEGIPFIACRGSGGAELLDEASQVRNLCEPSVLGLCEKLLEVITVGGATGTRSVSEYEVQRQMAAWIERQLRSSIAPQQESNQTMGAPVPILFVVVPAELDPNITAVDLMRVVSDYGGRVEIEVLTPQPLRIRAALEAAGDSSRIHVSAPSSYRTIALSLAHRESTIIGICHISQLLSSTWMERARCCFAQNSKISALTGMVGSTISADTDMDPAAAPPSSYAVKAVRSVRRYLLGNAAALLTQAHETNSGFVVIRSDELPSLSEFGPRDEQYGRLKLMEDWIEELLLKLQEKGRRFELIPDLLVGSPVREEPFEINRRNENIRALAQTQWQYTPGSDQAVLARLAIDSGLLRERSKRNAEYLDAINQRTNKKFSSLSDPFAVQHGTELATLAYANGHIDLALDICAALISKGGSNAEMTIAAVVSSAIESIDLFEMIGKEGQFKRFNLEDVWSMKLFPETKQIQLHPNPSNKGGAALLFTSVDLSKITHFTSDIQVPSKAANPVRFRVEFISDDGHRLWSADKILAGGASARWRFECLEAVRGPCRVYLGVEMADPEDNTTDAFAAFIEPRFIHQP